MNEFIQRILRIDTRYGMIVYVGGLLVFSSLALGAPERLWKGLLIAFVYSAADIFWTYFRDRIWYLPLSSLVSGFILSVVVISNPPLWMALALPLAAVIAKQLIWLGKRRHIFNPAAFAMGALAFFTPSVSWWGMAWASPLTEGLSVYLFAALVAFGVFILWKQKRWHVAIPFFISYAFFLSLFLLWNGIAPAQLFAFMRPQILDGTVIFFATVMLIEPLTSMFPAKKSRTIYGVLVGFFAVFVTFLSSIPALGGVLANADPLVFGLLVGNLVASLWFLQNR